MCPITHIIPQHSSIFLDLEDFFVMFLDIFPVNDTLKWTVQDTRRLMNWQKSGKAEKAIKQIH